MFGGGVETRVSDPSFPIRPTAIRGQLQFWWRATVGAQYESLEKLRDEQSKVWGNTECASCVQVRVDIEKECQSEPCARYEKGQNRPDSYRSMPTWNPPFRGTALPYALFPFQGQLGNGRRDIEIDPASCIHEAAIKLTVIHREDIDFAKQVEPALWAWANFGGLGSRTRRGCGAIFCQELAPESGDDLRAAWRRHMPESFPQREWPTLAHSLLLKTDEPPDRPIPVWDYAIGLFRHFRQGEGLGRNQGQQSNRPGRSRWPEPETIRSATHQRLARHPRLAGLPDDAFPRAELGLPIVFHFQEQGDPTDTVLYPDQNRERMASPLILKPLALRNGKAIPLILRLQTPALSGVKLRSGNKVLDLPSTPVIRDPRLASYPYSPLEESPNGSAIEAFLKLAEKKGFTEVTR